MKDSKLTTYLKNILANYPQDWIKLTTHRLDVYKEELAKQEFLDELEALYNQNAFAEKDLSALPTAYDYIRLGHPLSSVLEWALAKRLGLEAEQLISFDSNLMPIMAILRTNKLAGLKTQILHWGELPGNFDFDCIQSVYSYEAELKQIASLENLPAFEGKRILILENTNLEDLALHPEVDFQVSLQGSRGSIVAVDTADNENYIAAIQHVRRRETVAMTPANCHQSLEEWLLNKNAPNTDRQHSLGETRKCIANITEAPSPALIASSGLSIQYAIMMGLIDDAGQKHPGKEIKIIVPPNCYGGTNDQARRIAALIEGVSIMDLPVDGDNDMVQSTEQVLQQCAALDAVPLIIAEIPTNPRVEVPNLADLRKVLQHKRKSPKGEAAVDPIFILDQTFCPNVPFLKENGLLSSVRAISYVSGSKFPSGGKCTAGYCVANREALELMPNIEKHLDLCDNQATALQLEILAAQMPSMLERIQEAYINAREFVNFIESNLPTAKINFVSEELAEEGFTPSVFSLDLPTSGDSAEEREKHKRFLNQKLIDMMITEIPQESKYCVSYGQLKGCYWTIPATSTQGTTKEADKDYIARVSLSPNLDLDKHKSVFKAFMAETGL